MFLGSGDLFDKVHAANQKRSYAKKKKKSSLLMEKMVSIIEELFNDSQLIEVERICKSIQPTDVATIIYTSRYYGGNPKVLY